MMLLCEIYDGPPPPSSGHPIVVQNRVLSRFYLQPSGPDVWLEYGRSRRIQYARFIGRDNAVTASGTATFYRVSEGGRVIGDWLYEQMGMSTVHVLAGAKIEISISIPRAIVD